MGLPFATYPREAWRRVDDAYGGDRCYADSLASARRTVLDFRGGSAPTLRAYDDDDFLSDAAHYQPGSFGFGTAFVSVRPPPPPPPPPAPEEPEVDHVRRLRPPPRVYDEYLEPVPRMRPRRSTGRTDRSSQPRRRRTHKRPFVVRAADCDTCKHCGANNRWGEPPARRACDIKIDAHTACMHNCMGAHGY